MTCYTKTLQISQHTTILLTETRHLGGTVKANASGSKNVIFVVMFNIINIIITKNNQHYI